MDHLRATHAVITGVAVGLQNTFIATEKLLRTFPSTAHLKIKHRACSRPSVLREIGLMVGPVAIVQLHRDRGLVSLRISPASSSRLMAATKGSTASPTRITQPSIVARLISMPASRSSIALCRYSGR